MIVEKLRLAFIIPPKGNPFGQEMARVGSPPALRLRRSKIHVPWPKRVRPRRLFSKQPAASVQEGAVLLRKAARLPDPAKLKMVLRVYLFELGYRVAEDLRVVAEVVAVLVGRRTVRWLVADVIVAL